MSFSGKVKEELAGQLSLARHCQVAELAALLCGCGRVEKMSDGNRKLWIQTENEAVARKSFTLLRKTFNIETAIVIREGSHLKRGKVYLVEVTDPARTEEVLQGTAYRSTFSFWGWLSQSGSISSFSFVFPEKTVFAMSRSISSMLTTSMAMIHSCIFSPPLITFTD